MQIKGNKALNNRVPIKLGFAAAVVLVCIFENVIKK